MVHRERVRKKRNGNNELVKVPVHLVSGELGDFVAARAGRVLCAAEVGSPTEFTKSVKEASCQACLRFAKKEETHVDVARRDKRLTKPAVKPPPADENQLDLLPRSGGA